MRKWSSGFFHVHVLAHMFRPTHASCTETHIITINKEVTITSLLYILIYLWSLKCEVMWPFTEHVFCLLVLDAHWFFPSYLSWEGETWFLFTDEESEAESNVMEPVSKHRPVSAGETRLW